jgi:hypothetical protein
VGVAWAAGITGFWWGNRWVIDRVVGARPVRLTRVVVGAGFRVVAVSCAVGLAGGSAALVSRGFDKAVDFAMAAFDVGL